jgi:ATP-binding cassette subfamily B (MDR/TAP) protein 6
VRRPPAPEGAASALRQALLGAAASPADGAADDPSAVEAGGRKRQRHRSWVWLVGTAAQYMWPTGFWLRARACVCVALVLALRLLNLAVPIAYKRIIDNFAAMTAATRPAGGQPPAVFPFAQAFFPAVATYLGLWMLQGGGGGGGLLSNLRSYLWIPIGQNSYRRACLDIFTHVLHMDHAFHTHRRTGELLRIMDRGTASMQTLLSTVAFQIGPALFDIAAAAIFMALRLKPWIAAIVFATLGAYIPMTVAVTEWRGRFRRDLNSLDNARGARATDALLNYETVKIFGNEALEARQYAAAIDAYQVVDFKLSASMNLLNVAQSAVIFVGLAAGMVVCTSGVADGSLTVGDTVLFVTLMQQVRGKTKWWSLLVFEFQRGNEGWLGSDQLPSRLPSPSRPLQLYAPLNYFGTYYRMIQNSMLDMEGVISLLQTQPDVSDAPAAAPLRPSAYQVEFKDVSFSVRAHARAAARACSSLHRAPVFRSPSCLVPLWFESF